MGISNFFKSEKKTNPGLSGLEKPERSNSPENPDRREKLITLAAAALFSGLWAGKRVRDLYKAGETKETHLDLDKDYSAPVKRETPKPPAKKTPAAEIDRPPAKEKDPALRVCKNAELWLRQIENSPVWPKNLFTPDLFLAQEMQESKFGRFLKSPKGAVGVMQNMGISVKDVLRYLGKLQRNTKLKFEGLEDLDGEVLEKAMEIIHGEEKYSRAFGKIFMAALGDEKYGYAAGKAEGRQSEEDRATEKRKRILAAYNGGPSLKGLDEDAWPEESKKYAYKVLNYEERIRNIREALAETNVINPYDDETVKYFALMMDFYKSQKEKYRFIGRTIEKIMKSPAAKGKQALGFR
ncbi:MAG: hypothetical protein WCW77_00290 [Patescibacteria group bacterium]|jgi:hypothetical protein